MPREAARQEKSQILAPPCILPIASAGLLASRLVGCSHRVEIHHVVVAASSCVTRANWRRVTRANLRRVTRANWRLGVIVTLIHFRDLRSTFWNQVEPRWLLRWLLEVLG